VTNAAVCTQCEGSPLVGGHCLGHLTSKEVEYVAQRVSQGEPLDARRARLTSQVLSAFLLAVGRAAGTQRPQVSSADFSGAKFVDGADFSSVDVQEDLRFDQASFSGDVSFVYARVDGEVSFEGCGFKDAVDFSFADLGEVNFNETVFSSDVDFFDVTFVRQAYFRRTEFRQSADFTGAEFFLSADFLWTRFSGKVDFLNAKFFEPVEFLAADFHGAVDFTTARFSRDASFISSRFRDQVLMRVITVAGALKLRRVIFDDTCRIDVAASELSCFGSRFGGRTELNVRWAEMELEDCAFSERARLAGAGAVFGEEDELAARSCRVDRRLDAAPRPRLMTLKKADVENLALENVDLRACLFAGAHGLDRLRLEGNCEFAEPPRFLRYTNRRVLAEEHYWRAGRGAPGWNPPECRQASSRPPLDTLDPSYIASAYRSLRKAYEDSKDEPGAADFYYGEMEMRRLNRVEGTGSRVLLRSSGERAVLGAYWLVAGYGLRASRAAISLILAILLGAVLLSRCGFDGASHPPAGIFSVESAINLLRPPAAELTTAGELTQIGLRLLGPLFLALMILSLRSRVKR
jgi:uncharacterized protein YjbI with pentapeptide repeats